MCDRSGVLARTRDLPLGASERGKRRRPCLATPLADIGELADAVSGPGLLPAPVTLFNEVSLSPWTDLVEKTLALLGRAFCSLLVAEVLDFEASLLTQLGRHLTAYDLIKFHHRVAANYPDALLLDAVLKDYLARIEATPAPCEGPGAREQLRRRARRQAWMLRRRYEGSPVPEVPTSPGENLRAAGPHVRIAEEEILQPHRRRRFLYSGDPLPHQAQTALRQSMADLSHPAELRELTRSTTTSRVPSATTSSRMGASASVGVIRIPCNGVADLFEDGRLGVCGGDQNPRTRCSVKRCKYLISRSGLLSLLHKKRDKSSSAHLSSTPAATSVKNGSATSSIT